MPGAFADPRTLDDGYVVGELGADSMKKVKAVVSAAMALSTFFGGLAFRRGGATGAGWPGGLLLRRQGVPQPRRRNLHNLQLYDAHFRDRCSAARPPRARHSSLAAPTCSSRRYCRPTAMSGSSCSRLARSASISNPIPGGNWNKPDTFSSGILIGRYQIAAQEFVQLPTFTRAVGTLTLTFSRDFSFNGKTYNLRNLLPVYTFDDTISNTPVPGISGFPDGIAYGGDCLAVATTGQD